MPDDKGTIRIPRPAFEHHNERRKELGQTWEQYIDGQAPEESSEDLSALASALETVEERTGRIERTLDQLTEGRR